MVGRADHDAYALVAEGGQVAPGALDGDGVVAGDAGEVEAFYGCVDQYDGDTSLGEPVVMLVRLVRLREETAGEDHSGDLLLEQEVHVVRLRDAALGLGAEDRGESLLREGAADDLGESREDRVLELRQYEADQPGPLPLSWVGRS